MTLEQVAAHADGLHCPDRRRRRAARARPRRAAASTRRARVLERLAAIFPGRLHVELQRHRLREEEHRNQALVDLARRLRLPLVATNGVRYARPKDKALHDVLTSIRHHVPLDAAGRLLAAQRERHFKGAARDGARSSPTCPGAVDAAGELAARLDFTLADLGYRFPEYPLPPGETPSSYLRHLTWNGARARFRPLTAKAQAQLEKELALIEKLDLAGYFLIVWDIVRFCLENRILVQGRGSAANSAVCYALSITAVDPVKMELLFERFLSEERGEWPDIDLDLPSGDQRERVIQHVYQRYGPHGAAMTANVITYRDRSSAREVGKALGYSPEQVDRLSKQLGGCELRRDPRSTRGARGRARRGGFDPEERRACATSCDSGPADPEPAAPPRPALRRHGDRRRPARRGRAARAGVHARIASSCSGTRTTAPTSASSRSTCSASACSPRSRNAIPMIRTHEGVEVDLAHLPPDDPAVYRMLQRRRHRRRLPGREPRADGDAAAQRAAALLRPRRPGGDHPAGADRRAAWCTRIFERRARARSRSTYPHPSLEPILKRTLGVPLFQEQLLRMAMVAAGFTGGEAEELRRAMGFKRSVERMRRDRDAAARRHGRARHRRRGAGRDRPGDHRRSRSTASPSRTPRASR